jgi:hypothetical protein
VLFDFAVLRRVLPFFSPMDYLADLSGIGCLILALLGSWYHHYLQGQQDAEQSRR